MFPSVLKASEEKPVLVILESLAERVVIFLRLCDAPSANDATEDLLNLLVVRVVDATEPTTVLPVRDPDTLAERAVVTDVLFIFTEPVAKWCTTLEAQRLASSSLKRKGHGRQIWHDSLQF